MTINLSAYLSGGQLGISPVMAAEYLQVSRPRVDALVEQSLLASFLVRGETRYFKLIDARSLMAYLDQREGNPSVNVPTLKERLTELARERRVAPYDEVMGWVGMTTRNPRHRDQIGRMLGRVSEESFAEHRVMLSVLAVRKTGDKMPNESFFQLARTLRAQPESLNNAAFFERHRKEVFRIYGNLAV